MMRVVHVSLTPVAGSPIRICHALEQHTDVSARHVMTAPRAYGKRTFPGDLTLPEDRDEVLALLDACDIIHLHQFFDLSVNPFEIDFARYQRRGKRIVRQLHSALFHFRRVITGPLRSELEREVVTPTTPQLVIPHCAERYFPNARVVPNLVPVFDDRYRPSEAKRRRTTVVFSPSTDAPAWHTADPDSRWNTKGLPETERLLKRVVRRNDAALRVIRNTPFEDCLRLRRNGHLSIDDMVTGSFHLSSLETLSMGIPTFAFLDNRTLDVLETLTGTRSHPWVNYRLEDAEAALEEFLGDATLREEVGAESRRWMEEHWNDCRMVQHYVRAYEDLLERPDAFAEPRFDETNRRQMWLVRGRDDALWRTRYAAHKASRAATEPDATPSDSQNEAFRGGKTSPGIGRRMVRFVYRRTLKPVVRAVLRNELPGLIETPAEPRFDELRDEIERISDRVRDLELTDDANQDVSGENAGADSRAHVVRFADSG